MHENKIIENYLINNDLFWRIEYSSKIELSKDFGRLFQILDAKTTEFTEHYRGDLFVDIVMICDLMYDESEEVSVYYMGFRKNGIDHAGFIQIRLESYSPTVFSEPLYKSICKIVIDKRETIPVVTLHCCEG